MAQTLFFETPNSIKATIPVNISWNPLTFNSANLGDFHLNLWLLRGDLTTDVIVVQHPAQLLAHNQSVLDSFVLWTPTINDVDVNVADAGSNQLAWEESKNNPDLNPAKTHFEGFSQGFGVESPFSSSSTSSASPTATSLASSPSVAASSDSKNNLPLILGLSIGLGLALLLACGAAIWFARHRRHVERSRLAVPQEDTALPAEHTKMMGSEMYGENKPVEMPSHTRLVQMPSEMP